MFIVRQLNREPAQQFKILEKKNLRNLPLSLVPGRKCFVSCSAHLYIFWKWKVHKNVRISAETRKWKGMVHGEKVNFSRNSRIHKMYSKYSNTNTSWKDQSSTEIIVIFRFVAVMELIVDFVILFAAIDRATTSTLNSTELRAKRIQQNRWVKIAE